jgi:Holliday junction resolvase RusA-like endonuclease
MAVVRFRFSVPGTPVQQGSKTGFAMVSKSGKSFVNITDANRANLKPFRQLVRDTARAAYSGPRLEGALVLIIDFLFDRPKSVSVPGAKFREFMTVPPDLDKLVRSIGDALTDSGTIRDDAQIVKLFLTKKYGEAGVHVAVGELREGENI